MPACVRKICWRQLCPWSYTELERRREKDHSGNLKSEDTANINCGFVQDASLLSQVPSYLVSKSALAPPTGLQCGTKTRSSPGFLYRSGILPQPCKILPRTSGNIYDIRITITTKFHIFKLHICTAYYSFWLRKFKTSLKPTKNILKINLFFADRNEML